MNTFEKIKNKLLKEQKKVQNDLKSLEDDDPLMENSLAESSEPGTDSWLADTHSRVVAVKHNLQELLQKIQNALLNLKKGKYGKCENCGKIIEDSRLEALPTATLCISCSKLPLKKRNKK